MIISFEIELSIKFETTEYVFLSLPVHHGRCLDHTDFGLKRLGLTLEFSRTDLKSISCNSMSIFNFNECN